MSETKEKKKRVKKNVYKEAFLAVLLKQDAPQLIKQVIFPTEKESKIVARVIHPNTQKVLWEKKYSKQTDINKIWVEANERYNRLKIDTKTWVNGTEETLKINTKPYLPE